MRLTLVRHGQTPSNVLGLLDTAPPGPGLTDLGQLQAAAIPRALAGQPIDAVFASIQLRAQQTAAPLAAERGLPVQLAPGLREIDAGDLEMAGDPDSVHRYIGTLLAWLEGDLRRRMPSGPSGAVVLEGTPGGRWNAISWSEDAIGGPELAAPAESGPAAEAPADEAESVPD